MEILQKVLMELEPYVIVVGSHARGTATQLSDIDLYVRRRPEKELEVDWYGDLEEHYIDKVIEIFNRNELAWDSLMVGYVHTENCEVQIEASPLFKIGKNADFKKISVFGVEMTAAVDDKELNVNDRFE